MRSFIRDGAAMAAACFATTGVSAQGLECSWDEQILAFFEPDVVGGAPYAFAVQGTYAYCTMNDFDLAVVDFSDPANPTVVSVQPAGLDWFYLGGVDIESDLLAVGTWGVGLHFFDISDPVSPTQVSVYPHPSYAPDVQLVGSIAYAAMDESGFYILDVSSPASPTLIGSLNFPTGGSGEYAFIDGVRVSGDRAYLTDQEWRLFTVDISTPSSPVLLGSVSSPGLHRWSLWHADGNIVYARYSTANNMVLDMTDPNAPVTLYTFPWSGSMRVFGDTAYMHGAPHTNEVYDISNTASPVLTATYPDGFTGLPFHDDGALLYGNSVKPFCIVDPSIPPHDPVLDELNIGTEVWEISVIGDTAYVVTKDDRFLIIDASDPSDLQIIGTYATPTSYCTKFDVVGDLVFLTAGCPGEGPMEVIDISDPSTPTLIGSYGDPGQAFRDVRVVGDTAYLAANPTGLYIVDVSDPTTPALLGTGTTPSYGYQVEADGSTVYLMSRLNGLFVFDASTPSSPTVAGTYAGGSDLIYPDFIALVGDTLYTGSSCVCAIDVSDPMAPALADSLPRDPNSPVTTVSDGRAYTTRGGQLTVADVGDPYDLRIAYWSNEDPALEVVAPMGSLAIASSGDSIVSIDLSPCPSCLPDVTTQGAGSGDPGYGVPDGGVTSADIQFFVNAWVAPDASVADLTTTGAGSGDPGYGVPDGTVTAADLNYYVNLWVAGCP